MRRRLYFVLPDLDSARRTADDLLLARIEHRHMYFLARRGMELHELHEATTLQKTDLVHGAELGLLTGGAIGLAAGALLVLGGPAGLGFGNFTALGNFTVLLSMLICAAFGAWVASMVGASVPNSRLLNFSRDIASGHILLMVDVPASRVETVRDLVHRRHPEAADRGIEPAIPAFP